MQTEQPTIMVVEDETLLLQAISKKLKLSGLDVVSCASGQQAIDYLSNMDEHLPSAVWLDYYLKETSATPIQLEIFDFSGKLVRQFASDDKLYKTNPNRMPLTMNWVRDPLPLVNEPGMHRFVWDLHYALPPGVQRSYFFSAGPWVVPGNYSVKLTANGKSTTQSLIIKMDPRSKASADALQTQLTLAAQLSARLGEVSSALKQAKELRQAIAERKKDAAGKTELLAALDALNQKMEIAVEPDADGEFEIFGLALPGKEREPLPQAQSALTGLFIIEQSADTAPSADVSAAAAKWDAAAGDSLSRWKAVLSQDLAIVNSQLQKADLQPLAIK